MVRSKSTQSYSSLLSARTFHLAFNAVQQSWCLDFCNLDGLFSEQEPERTGGSHHGSYICGKSSHGYPYARH